MRYPPRRRHRPDPADGKNGQAGRDRLAADLAAARAKLNRQRKALTASERAIAELSQKLIHAGG